MRNVDERVVQMQFDNKQFENGINTSLKSINNLKSGLNFDKSVNSLSGMASSIENISSKFSALGIVGVTAIANIANSAVNAGKRLISSLTIDPIMTGFKEYETKMGAIQTILTNTASKGTTIEDVNKVLNDLNIYSDKTIYNFAEMAKNIGTFTAAGVDLDVSATAIKGIANLAAGSGSTSLQASTAMYQLSQALAAGSVKLMDWNSVVNAGMGGELFKNALTTTAKEMGIFVDETKPFRETLEQGWITSDVLTTTLAKFAEDEMLVKAATQVKTLTQLLDTMKESVQSGWAQSWEAIIGNKEEAAAFFTAINDGFGAIVGSSAEARNATLAFWKANGGRDLIIESLSNAFKGLQTILKPIGEAFREIFPAITGQTLVDISTKIRDLTANFKIGEKTAENLKNTFKGLFALLDIGKQVLTTLATAFFAVLKFILPVGDSMLSVTGNFGEFIVAIDNALKSSNAFGVVLKTLGGIIGPIAKGIRSALVAMIDAFAAFGIVDTSDLDSLGNRVEARLEPFIKLGAIIEAVVSVFYKLASIIGKVFNKMGELFTSSLGSPDFKAIFDVINGGLITAILYNVNKFTSSLSSMTGILDGVRGSLEAYQTSLKAGALLKIAIAMGILSASLVALSLIDSAKLTSALAAMAGMFIELFAAMSVFEGLAGGLGFFVMTKITTGMIGMSVAILILTGAMVKLSELNWGEVARGLAAVAGMMAVLLVAAKVMSTTSGMLIRSAIGFVIFAAALNVLTKAVEKLSALNAGNLAKGLIGVGVLMTELVLFMKATDLNKMGVIRSVGILVFAGALNVLALAVKKLADIDPGALIRGLTGIAVILAEIVIFTKTVGNPSGIISTSVALTILGGALILIAKAVTSLGSMSWGEVSRGLIAFGGALLAITLMFKLMPKGILIQSLALLDVAGSMMMLAKALSAMGAMSWDQIARGLTAMTVSLGVIIGAFVLLNKYGSLADSSAFIVMAASVIILAYALKTLGSLSLPQIGTALIGLAGAFAIIGVAAMVLTPLIPAILGLAGAIALLGVGVALIGGGVLALSTGLAALAVSGTAASVALVAMVTGLIGLIPYAFTTLAQGIVNFAKVLGDGSVIIAEAAVKIVLAVVKALSDTIPVVVDAIFKLLTAILKTLVEYIPQIVDAGMKLIIGFLKGIADNIGEVVATAIMIVVNFIEGVAAMIPKVIQAGVDLVLSFVNGLAEALRGNTQPLTDAITNLMDAIITTGIKVLTGSIEGFVDVGENIVEGLLQGIKNKISHVVEGVTDLAQSAINAAKVALDTHSPSQVFADIGKNLSAGLAIGITDNSDVAVSASEDMSNKVAEASSNVAEESNEAAKKAFDASVAWIDDRKYYNELSLNEELAAWERVQARYLEGTEERKKADKEVYRVKKELIKSEYDYSLSWIDDRKYYNELGLNEELDAWERVQKRYAEGTEDRKKADREVYRVKKELATADADYAQGVIDISQAANDKRIQLEQDYYNKTKEINDRLKSDIQSLNDEYDNAVKSRADSLYNAYGLFDKVDSTSSVSGKQLLRNLQSQTTAFATWQSNLSTLSGKGVSEDFIAELKEMGPGSLAQIKALNTLSAPELDTYVSLWQTKHSAARTEAVGELEGLRIDTQNQIANLNSEAQTELEEYRETWKKEMELLSENTNKQLSALTAEWLKKIGTLKSTSENDFVTLTNNIQTIMTSPDWVGVGENIVGGMVEGIEGQAGALAYTAANVAIQALQAAKDALGVKSPSKEFAKVGAYSVEGFINGLKKVSGVVTSAKDLGKTAVSSLQKAIANAADIASGDLNLAPTIRPVLDLTNIEAGKKNLNGLFSTNGISVTGTNNRVSTISKELKSTSPLDAVASLLVDLSKTKDGQNGSVSFEGLFKDATFTVRTDSDITKIAREVSKELYNLQQSVSRGRGLVTI